MHSHLQDEGHVNFAAMGTLTIEVPSLIAALHHDLHVGEHAKAISTVRYIGDLKW
jgi:hypothetical protein